MNIHKIKLDKTFKTIAQAFIFFAIVTNAQAALTGLSTAPLVTSSSSSVLPNLLFVLDDSGSMDWDYMPDWANSNQSELFRNADYNGLAYNPATTYTPPIFYNADGSVNTTTYPSQTGQSTATGASSSAKPNWKRVENDAYGIQSNNTSDLTNSANFYTFIAGEYCTAVNLRSCVAATAPSATHPFPAKLRWCSSTTNANATAPAAGSCQAVRFEVGPAPLYNRARYPGVGSTSTATITVGGSGSTSVTSIKVNGLEILSGPTTFATSTAMANNIRNAINNCTAAITGACGVSGYSASSPGSDVTITSPYGAGPITFTLSGPMTITATAFTGGVPGSNLYTGIVSSNNSYGYPGTASKASTRTDCAGTTCTYVEEMTNYANWWTYYHTRMQMMKTAASIAFATLDEKYRLGYMSINNNNNDYLNLDTFEGTQKGSWYNKLTTAEPSNSTPLRTALTKAGRLYAGKFNGTTLNGSRVVDPLQYSCQQNFTILSTDGYWNEPSNPDQINGTTDIGNQDGTEPRPFNDGTGSGGGSSNTLADVAEYYYLTDLRTAALNNCTGTPVPPATTGNTLCTIPAPATLDPLNNVPGSGDDANAAQHMTTFTLGLGASGYMQYTPNYASDTSGDFFSVKNGTAPSNGVCGWQTSGSCNWPVPKADEQTTIDDLWHAGVNGRGAYFSATNPASLSSSLATALAGVTARTGSSAAATTSNPNIASGDNFVFSSTFTSQDWDGELVRQQLNLTTGVTSSTVDWAAQALLDANTARTIYTFDSATANKLQAFSVANFGSDANFSTPNISSLSQFCASGVTCLSPANQTAAAGNNLVSFLRGDRTNEGVATDASKYYRQRTHVLGDIVNAEAVYVKSSLFNYSDFGYFGYSTFAAGNATRTGVIYAAANDGMLHAFRAGGTTVTPGDGSGEELWAYIPSQMLPNLYKLADKNYTNLHRYYVDGTPVVGDICLSTSNCTTAATAQWRTILVGGFNRGGRGYYALDITDPVAPKALWEFTDSNMGYTYGNPKIAKLKDGTWVVLVTSGYNNVLPGDGKGRLYILNATTGALIRSISTGVGSAVATVTGCSVAPCPSGLAKIAVRVVNPSSDSTVLAVYGGDLFGNLWRFDVNGDVGAPGFDAQLLAVLRGTSGNYQPITSKPELGTISGNSAVFVGTGRYLGAGDLSDTAEQSIYAIKDPLTGTSSPSVAIYNNPRTFGGFVKQTQTTTTCPVGAPITLCASGQIVRTSSSNVVNFATGNGWFFDLPDGVGGSTPGNGSERANTDPVLALGTLGFTTNVPNSNACTVGGYSYRYFLDYRTGAAVSTSTGKVVATKLGSALATRPVYVRLPNNTIVELTRLSDGTTVTSNVPIGGVAGATRRTSWRELTTEE